jgi:hypothetical protein
MRTCVLFLLFALVSLISSSQALSAVSKNAAPCTISLPANVVVADGRLIRDLNAGHFVAQVKHEPVKVIAATEDSGPHRILLVLETGRHVPERVRAAEYSIVADVLSEARPEDSFGLLTARGLEKRVGFGESRNAILAAVGELESNIDSKDRGNGVLDALMAAAGWFDQPRLGDAILLMTMGLESEHHASFKQVRKVLTDRQVRIFSLRFAPRVWGTITGPTVRLSPTGPEFVFNQTFVPNMEDEGSLSWASGGYSVQVDIVGGGQREERLNDEKLEALKTAASRMQSAITEYYRLTVNSSPAQITLGLASDLKNKVPNAVVIYPAQLPACPVAKNP